MNSRCNHSHINYPFCKSHSVLNCHPFPFVVAFLFSPLDMHFTLIYNVFIIYERKIIMSSKLIKFLFVLISLYATNIIIKFLYCSFRIRYGNKLIKKLKQFSDNKTLLHRLRPAMERYCSYSKIKMLSYPFNHSNVNLLNKNVQSNIENSLNNAIGVYQVRRRYCYILFTINDNKKCITILITLVDVLIKLITSLCTANIGLLVEFLKSMLS